MNKFGRKWELFFVFFKIGAFTFGGGYAMIPLIQKEVVEKKKWICSADMYDILAISQSFPGAVAINTATIVGYRVGRYAGAVCATLGVVLPSFIIITLMGTVFTRILDVGAVRAALRGIGACVVSLLMVAAVRVARGAIKGVLSILVAAGALLLIFWANLHPIYAILMGIGAGLATYGFNLIKGGKQ